MNRPHASPEESFVLLLAMTAILLPAPRVLAGDPAPARAPGAWSFEVAGGAASAGNSGDLENGMRRSGFGDTACFWGCTTYPLASSNVIDKSTVWIAARRRLGAGPFHAGLAGAWATLPTVTGYDSDSGTYLNVDTRVITLVPMVWVTPAAGLRIGAGPSFNQVQFELGPSSGAATKSQRWVAGFLAEAAVTVPAATPVFFYGGVQYAWCSSATAGPWQGTGFRGVAARFEETTVRIGGGAVRLGIGGRF